ncbi:hypothetical protein SDC9_07485 [bioreactor metagenome]|uniref:Uncharacterized protein n=1 Tax=bioreactor metagenome TaxID=1076179 RepID=A0A644T4P4_9ZZZZ
MLYNLFFKFFWLFGDFTSRYIFNNKNNNKYITKDNNHKKDLDNKLSIGNYLFNVYCFFEDILSFLAKKDIKNENTIFDYQKNFQKEYFNIILNTKILNNKFIDFFIIKYILKYMDIKIFLFILFSFFIASIILFFFFFGFEIALSIIILYIIGILWIITSPKRNMEKNKLEISNELPYALRLDKFKLPYKNLNTNKNNNNKTWQKN